MTLLPLLYNPSIRKKTMFLPTFLTFITLASCLSLQGNWSLTLAKGVPLPKQAITLSIQQFIFKKSQILQKMTITGCRVMLLQAEVSNDQLFINFNTYAARPISNVTCGINNTQDQVYSLLATVFSFQISNDTLIFKDPYRNTVLSFKRVPLNQPLSFSGIWNLLQFGSTQTSLSVEISNTQITLCQGNLVLNYTAKEKNVIVITPVLSNCPSKNLTAALLSSKYVRSFNGSLQFYDSSVVLTAEFAYTSAYDPKKPLFAPASTPAPASATINNTQKQPPQPVPPPPVPSSPISTSNFSGKWTIQSLFNIPFPSSPYSITFSPSLLQLNGGCNNYSFPYSINNISQVITIGNSSSTGKACSQSDDQLYVSGVTKMYKYLLSSTNGLFTLKFYDQNGTSGYTLQINQRTNIVAPQRAPVPPPVQLPLKSGKYLLLLLQRRDLPRVLVNITSNMLTYKVCNTIQQIYLPAQLTSNNANITFTGGATTNSTCKPNNDDLYSGTLNQAKTYTYDSAASSVIFSNSAGIEIATLTQTA